MTLVPDNITFRGAGGIHSSTPSCGFKLWLINNVMKIPLPLLNLICPMFTPISDVITISYIDINEVILIS